MKKPVAFLILWLATVLTPFSVCASTMIYVSSPGNNTIMKYTLDGVGTVFANTGLDTPQGLAFDGTGNLFAADSLHHRVVKYTAGGVGSVFATTGTRNPFSLAFDGAGSLYTTYGPEIIKFTPGGIPHVFSFLDFPNAMVFDSTGTMLIANGFGGLSKVSANGGLQTDFVTSKISGEPSFFFPFGLALDLAGNIFVSHQGGNAIVKLSPSGAILDYVDNLYSDFNHPCGIAFDAAGNLYVANAGGNSVKIIYAGEFGQEIDVADTFASGGLSGPSFIAIGPDLPSFQPVPPVPEPSTWALLVFCLPAIFSTSRLRH